MKYLFLGLAISGLVCGYLVGASSTPVVGAALPVLGAVIMTAFSVHKAKVASEDLKVIKDLEASAQLEAIRMISGQDAISGKTIGLGMIAFFSLMLVGIFSGSHIRTHRLFLPKQEIFQPVWNKASKKPSTVEEALEWMKISHILLKGGLSEKDVAYVISLPSSIWVSSDNPVSKISPDKFEGDNKASDTLNSFYEKEIIESPGLQEKPPSTF